MWWTVAREAATNWSGHKDARQGAALFGGQCAFSGAAGSRQHRFDSLCPGVTQHLLEDVTCEVTASWLKKKPAIAMAITMIGPRENTEEVRPLALRPQLPAVVRARPGPRLPSPRLAAGNGGTGRGRQIRGSIHARGHSARRKHAGVVRRRDGALRDDVQVVAGRLRRLARRLAGRVSSPLCSSRWERRRSASTSASRGWNRPTELQPRSSSY